MRRYLRNKLVKESAWSLLAKFVPFPIYMLLNIYLVRMFGKERYGQWAFFFAIWFGVMQASRLGLDRAARTKAAQFRDTPRLQDLLVASLLLRLGATVLITAALWVLGPWVAAVTEHPELASVFRWSAPLLFFTGVFEHAGHLFMGMHRFKYVFFVRISEALVRLVAVGILLQVSATHQNAVGGYTIAAVCSAGCAAWILRGVLRGRSARLDGRMARAVAAQSVSFFLLTVLALALPPLNTVMLGVLSSDAQVAYFGSTQMLMAKLPQLLVALSMAGGPIFAKIGGAENARARKLLRRLLAIACGMALPALVVIQLAAPVIVTLLFGEEFAPAAGVLRVLALHMCLFSFSMVLAQVLDYQGLSMVRVRNLALASVLNLLLNLWLIPRYGALGAAVGQTAAYAPYLFLNVIEVRRVFRQAAQDPAEDASALDDREGEDDE
jgi:O-antigen/teichoic acid export membrane protein